MAQPVLVRAYTTKPTPTGSPSGRGHALPPIAAFTFADILRAADGPDLQAAIDGIAEICAKNRMSLAEEYASHMPPVGEITGGSSTMAATRPLQVTKPVVRRALTSVPEASSSGSEGSRGSRRRSIFGFGAKKDSNTGSMRVIRIGSMGRTIPAGCTTAVSRMSDGGLPSLRPCADDATPSRSQAMSAASVSLQRLLDTRSHPLR